MTFLIVGKALLEVCNLPLYVRLRDDYINVLSEEAIDAINVCLEQVGKLDFAK